MASQFLMFPMMEEDGNRLTLYSLKHKQPYNLPTLQNLQNFRCVGSCGGWLAFLDSMADPFLLNPLSRARLPLPPKHTLPVPHTLTQSNPTIVKLVLSSAAVVVLYSHGLHTKIAFCRHGDGQWSSLDCKARTYYDVVCCDRTNSLLALAPGPSVESWDLTNTIPAKTTAIDRECSPAAVQLADEAFPADLYSSQWYLALSPAGQMFVIVRYIGEFVRYDGEVVCEADTLTDYAAEPLVCPYKTVEFRVFKPDVGRREWVEVGCLDEFAVFVGGNQSVMVSTAEHDELKKNSIYFTDDYWERVDEDYSYGGHDMGVFSMEDGSIQPVLEDQQQKIQPPPVWISLALPNHIVAG